MSFRNTGSIFLLCLGLLYVPPGASAANAPRARWSELQARDYMNRQPWPVGSNFLPKDAINQLEMFQQATYDPAEIDKEFGWAESAKMTTMRIFLHDLLWQQDAQGFAQRIDNLLGIAAKHHIKPVLVLFDSCWDPNPVLGPQHPPIPGVHNSGWVQSPGLALGDPAQVPRLKAYVTGIVGRFAGDDRILAWDVWNEPDNPGGGNYKNLPNKVQLVEQMLPQVFEWARSVGPIQPLTSGVWKPDSSKQYSWSDPAAWSPTERIQLTQSDIISFHDYSWPEQFEARIVSLEKLHRPILCTEYMARGAGSTIDNSLPIAAQHHVGAINWGLVQGKMQTWLPWDSWQVPYVNRRPPVWFHDLFYPDGRPYREHEIAMIRRISEQMNKQ
jgi:Cellulase (glycosyl hydrolase family 5)